MSRNSYAADVVNQIILPTWWMYVWIIFILHRCILQNALYELSRIKFFIKCSTDSSQFTSVIACVHSYIDNDDVLMVISTAMNKHHYYAKCISLLKHRKKKKQWKCKIVHFRFCIVMWDNTQGHCGYRRGGETTYADTRTHRRRVKPVSWEWYWELYSIPSVVHDCHLVQHLFLLWAGSLKETLQVFCVCVCVRKRVPLNVFEQEQEREKDSMLGEHMKASEVELF